MATFKCLTNLLFVLLWVNGLALADDDDNTGDLNNPALDHLPKPDIDPDQADNQANDNVLKSPAHNNTGNNPANGNNGNDNPPKPADDDDDGGFGNENEKEEGNENVDLAAAGIKHRFLESEEVEEEEKVKIKPPDNAGSKPKPALAEQNPAYQYPYFNKQEYVTNQVNQMFNNDPNNIPLIISYANQGDIEHELLVLKALKKILKDLKNFDITGKIAIIQDLERHVLMMPGITPNQKSDAEILKRQFYKMVNDQMTEEIKKAIVNRIPLNTPRYVLNSKTLLEHNEEFCRKIIERSVGELFKSTAERVNDLIDGVSTLPFISQNIHGLRAIFNQFETKNCWDKRYKDVFLLAKALYNIENLPDFYGVSVATRDSFYYMKENLPYSVKNLIWAQYQVCLKNMDTFKYLYPANMTTNESPVISTTNSLFLINFVPQEGVWNLKEKKENFRIINLYYGKCISGENEDEKKDDKNAKKEYPNKYEIILQDDAVLIKNVKTNKYLKDVGATTLRGINKVGPVNLEMVDDKFLWVIEDCRYDQMVIGPTEPIPGVVPFNFGNTYSYK